jgi:ADP-ribose pyrophosphatase YjhB (NUDIX family)
MNNNYCNNCGKAGHLYHQCKLPITSFGIIAFRIYENDIQYLMIRRKDTLGYIDFMRGKYSLYNKDYILNMLKQMTVEEKEILGRGDFDLLWKRIWGDEHISNQYKSEENISREKFNALCSGIIFKNELYTLTTLIEESNKYDIWTEPEWGFPKGRRNYQESDYESALREFQEETGYNIKQLKNIKNILPFEEIFTGSNYKSYKHKYYLTFMKLEHTLQTHKFEPTEVSKMEWKSFEDCIQSIRNYNLEKKRILTNINETIKSFRLFCYQ